MYKILGKISHLSRLFSDIVVSLIGFKNCLSTFSGIAPNEQILLIGPPFKRLDTQVMEFAELPVELE